MKNKKYILTIMLMLILALTGCDSTNFKPEANSSKSTAIEIEDKASDNSINFDKNTDSKNNVSLNNIPDYSGLPCVEINNNKPFFDEKDKKTTEAFEKYSSLDELGRCGVAYANICKELQPTDERGQIGSVKPSGWQTAKYNGYIEGNYLYNRCHLIGYQLAGENANEKNLITGTRYMNCDGQLPFEDMVDDYVDETNNHVLYRVTPIFEGNNLIASGVLTEAYSVEDNGKGLQFCVYCYNVQPGINIDYATGNSQLIEEYTGEYSTSTYYSTKKIKSYSTNGHVSDNRTVLENNEAATEEKSIAGETYILNKNTMKFHKPDCRYTKDISDSNRAEVTKNKEELSKEGYEPCKVCNP